MTRPVRGLPPGAILLAALALLASCARPEAETAGKVLPLDPDTLSVWMSRGVPVLLLDLRPRSAFRPAHISGAMPVAGKRISDLREVLPRDPSVPLVFYDADGVRPAGDADLAGEAAERYRFPLVYWLVGGLEAWTARGYGTDGYRYPGREP